MDKLPMKNSTSAQTVFIKIPISHTRCSLIFILITSLWSLSAQAQYYYKDLLGTAKQNQEFSLLKNGHIRLIQINSFDENDQPSEGFFCEKKINENATQSKMVSKSNITGQSLIVTDYDNAGRVIRTLTTTPYTVNKVDFEYNSKGQLSLLRTSTSANGGTDTIIETHEYFYSEGGQPEKMIRKKNNTLISTITFVTGDKGHIIEENAAGSSHDIKYYYYYDDSSRLTDVVHYNLVAKRLLPDYIFEYTTGTNPKQMMAVQETGRNYFIWKYAYDDKNLPEIQKCYSKEKRLLGTIQFEYK